MENVGFYEGNNSVRTNRLAFEAESPRIISRSSASADSSRPSDNDNNDDGGGGRGGRRWAAVIMDIMTVDGCSCDVFMDSEKISWIPLSGERTKSARIKQSKSIRSREIEGNDTSGNTIYLSHVLGANIRRLQKTGQLENQGTCIGFGVYVYRVKESGVKFVEEVVLFNHPSEQISKKWCLSIQQCIASKTERPRSVKVFLQPFAGKRCSRTIFSSRVQPLFIAAGISSDITEVNRDGSNISQIIYQMNLSDYNSVVCVGGDGTVSRVVTAMLNRVQADEGIDMEKTGFAAKCCPLPIGIVPTGSINETVFSLIGTDDITTAVIHILLGHVTAVDVCSVRNDERFLRWSFNSHFGFFGSLFAYANKYSVLGEKRFEMTVVRMLSKNKYRPFSCCIQFIPADNAESDNPRNGMLCREGCVQCKMSKEASDPTAFNYGQVEAFNDSDSSGSSSSCRSIKAFESDERYQTISGSFLSVSLLTMSGLCAVAPSGHSPFTHIQDGCVDLVVVENVERKEFVRYIRRFSNTKNQLDLPFVKSFRCKEIRVTPAMNKSGNNNDDHSTGISNPAVGGQSCKKVSTRSESRNSSEESEINVEKQNSDSSADSAGEEETRSGEVQKTRQSSQDISHQGIETVKVKRQLFRRRTSKLQQALVSLKSDFLGAEFAETSTSELPSGSTGSSFGKRKKFQPMWILGMELHDEQHLQFRVHEGLVKFHGLGIPSSYQPSQLKWPCLAMF